MYERTIRLDAALPLRARRVTLLHELIHLWLHDAGVELTHDMEEVVCCTLSTALVAHEDFTKKRAKKR
jgi:Zn-dependent peptidase ImmA (M78 family)